MSTINTLIATAGGDGSGNPLLDEALRLARLGYFVFPCKPGTKEPLTKNGFKNASRDEEVICAWWAKYPSANLAVSTECMLVLDVDGPDNPYLAVDGRAATVESFPQSVTPRGGHHYWMRQPTGVSVRNSAGKLAEHVDTRGDGGYVVVAPSVVNGKAYEWQVPLNIGPESLPPAPEWLVKELLSAEDRPAKRRSKGALTEGSRNSELTSIAGRMRRRGLSQEQIAAKLAQVNEHQCVPPLPTDEVESIAASVSRYEPDEPSGRRQIVVAPDEARVADEVIQELVKDPEIFRRGTRLVHVMRSERSLDGTGGELYIAQLPIPSLRERISRLVELVKIKPDGEVKVVHPPGWLVLAIDARGRWPGVRELIAVSDTPIIRPDGSIHQSAGYDPETAVLFDPAVDWPMVPEQITDDHMLAAGNDIMEVACDFRFVADCHKAAYLASLLTVVGRYTFSGPAPLFLFEANVRGAGKTLLAQTVAVIAAGRAVGASAYIDNDDEMRKQITAKLIEARRIILFDNIAGCFGNATIDRLLTTTLWEDRQLGLNLSLSLPAFAVAFATGNNVTIKADTARRVIPVRLEVMDENPEDRSGFRHADLLGWVTANRQRLWVAAATLLAGSIRRGERQPELAPFGSFEGWTNVIRRAVVSAGFADPCEGRAQLAQDSDRASEELGAVLEGVLGYDPGGRGFVVAEMVRDLYTEPSEIPDEVRLQLRAALECAVGSKPGQQPTARQVGTYFKSVRKRVVAQHYLDAGEGKGPKGKVWRVRGNKETPPAHPA